MPSKEPQNDVKCACLYECYDEDQDVYPSIVRQGDKFDYQKLDDEGY